MPVSWAADEDVWAKAKKAVLPHAGNYDEPYAVVADVYKKMGGKVKKKKETAPTDPATAKAVKNMAPSVGFNWFGGFFKPGAAPKQEAKKKAK